MLKLESLSYAYQKDGENTLGNLNVNFSKESCVGLLGENGVGKPIIFLSMLGICRPSQGEVYYQDKELPHKKENLNDLRSRVSMVFQDLDQQIFYSSVGDDIAFALKNQKLDPDVIEDKVRKAAGAANITRLVNQPVHYLSYGQEKGVAIAGILAIDREAILFDKPTASLGPPMAESIKELLVSPVARGKKLIVSSHDVDFIYDVHNYVYVISHGEVVIKGGIGQVFLNEKAAQEAGSAPPTLVRMHPHGETPPFKEEKDLYSCLRGRAGDCL